MTSPHVLLLTGGPHPFAETTPILVDLLADEGGDVMTVDDPDGAAIRLDGGEVDLLVLNTLRWRMTDPRYDDERADHGYSTPSPTRASIGEWLRGGGRLLACHAAPICFDDWPEWGDLLGARWVWGTSSHPPLGEVSVHVASASHPLVRGLQDAVITDECYGFLEHTIAIEPLLESEHSGATHPLLWEHHPGSGHVVVSLLGHGADSFQHPLHQTVLRRAVHHLLSTGTS